jgi:hypothetical protein
MKRIMMLLLIFLLIGCHQQLDEVCNEDICINSVEFGIEGTISVTSNHRDTVAFESIITDEMRKMKTIELAIYSSELSLIGSIDVQADDIRDTKNLLTAQFTFRSLEPSKNYIAVIYSSIYEDDQNWSVTIAKTEFTTEDYVPIEPTGFIDHIRVGESFVIYDIELLSDDYRIIAYGIFLYIGDQKIDEFTVWGDMHLKRVSTPNLVFSDLISDTDYILKFDVIYESGSDQHTLQLFETTFKTE